ncbi:hypothetical protein [Chryseoglobus sp. 28M-23]|uniref:hypothetical protein n=1 Tax=Chryseoglobus sp. 28M-23 TaxID=2772253 RepID=UPI001746BC31|nr:hypothetical protein [Chryseoglobus sp. 28M-23]QOD92984.1 hypothetical protein IE160_08490 [Chryseoglobus sp. 28M-23]
METLMKRATIDQIPSGNWRVRIRQTDGSRISLGGTFKTKEDAQQALELAEARRLIEAARSVTDGDGPLFAPYATHCIDEAELRPRTKANYHSLLRTALADFRDRPIQTITPSDMRMWWSDQGDHPTNRRNALWLFRKVVAMAIEDGFIERDPSLSKSLRGGAAHKPRPGFTEDQFLTVIEHVEPIYRVPLLVAYSAHTRLGELLGLNEEDYNRGLLHG